MKKQIFFYLLSAVGLLSAADADFQIGTPREVPSHIMGFGRELIYAINKPHVRVNRPDELPLLREIGAQALRGPAGTPSNYYLWKTGFMYSSDEFPDAAKLHSPLSDPRKCRIAPNQGANSKTPRPVTLKDVYAQAAELNIPYTFCVNIVHETPESVVELVKAIKKLSRQPISLEMGNELYEPGKSFRDAGEYVDKVRRISNAVKALDPNVKIGVVSPAFPAPDDRMSASMLRDLAKTGNRGCTRYMKWPEILSENRDAFDAVILHPYIVVKANDFNFTQDSLMAYFFAWNACMQERLNYEVKRFFPGKELWITEYNILPWIVFSLQKEMPNRFQFAKTPGAAIVNLETMLRFIDQGNVTEAFLHTFNDTQCFGTVQADWTNKGRLIRLPNFYAFKELGRTLKAHQYYYPLTASNVKKCSFLLNLHHVSQGPERIDARYEAVGAWGFGSRNSLKTVYYLNRTGKSQKVSLDGRSLRKVWSYGGEEPFPEFQTYSRNWTFPPAILPKPESFDGPPVKELLLKPFSMTIADVSAK